MKQADLGLAPPRACSFLLLLVDLGKSSSKAGDPFCASIFALILLTKLIESLKLHKRS